ncbi:DUF3168 domain-containing protein [Stenotrophomonas sp. NPDC078853]|uniref:tail completion protein gp17 n=1 Tax=Stenotrophomonas sp. NPDC078853 TaxID=3364534 RepID=UPI00384FFF6C
MLPPVFNLCKASPAVLAALGSDPIRVYPFGKVPKQPSLPYSVWQELDGVPGNNLAGRPTHDYVPTQHDIYADDRVTLETAVMALRKALERGGVITRLGGTSIDDETSLYRYSFDVDWHLMR